MGYKILVLVASFFVCNEANAQYSNCYDLMKAASIKWKEDSLGRSGYRYKCSRLLLTCDWNEIEEASLIRLLGRPNGIKKEKEELIFIYMVRDGNNMADTSLGISGTDYVMFHYSHSNKKIVRVSRGYSCG